MAEELNKEWNPEDELLSGEAEAAEEVCDGTAEEDGEEEVRACGEEEEETSCCAKRKRLIALIAGIVIGLSLVAALAAVFARRTRE